jgi:hypothetical protein
MDLEKLVQPTVNQLRKTVSFLTCAPRFDVPDVAHLKGKQIWYHIYRGTICSMITIHLGLLQAIDYSPPTRVAFRAVIAFPICRASSFGRRHTDSGKAGNRRVQSYSPIADWGNRQ